MNTLDAAQRYVNAGLAVYPAAGDKRALIRAWNAAGAVRDPERVAALFKQFPGASVGIACGPSQRIVVDVDPRNGGTESFQKLCGEIGLEAFALCPTVKTPSGGSHHHFSAPSERIRSLPHALGRGIDIIGFKGGVVAPPSTRAEGAYAWRCPDGWPETFDAPTLPDALLDRIRRRSIERVTRRLTAQDLPPLIERGSRNTSLAIIGIKLRWKLSLPEAALAAVLMTINTERCRPPLEEKEIRVIAYSAAQYPVSAVDPARWFEGWLSEIQNGTELRVAATLMVLAEAAFDELTPSADLIQQRSGLQRPHYYTARKLLEERGAILVHSRGRKLAPVIELVPRTSLTNAA
ncbi:MAG: bifunctional DNA primase/polymerase [Candidatus Cybelea sp.]